jgi:hypothetical protein
MDLQHFGQHTPRLITVQIFDLRQTIFHIFDADIKVPAFPWCHDFTSNDSVSIKTFHLIRSFFFILDSGLEIQTE